MPSPQVEDGYTRIANELLEAMMTRMPCKISDPVLVFMAVMRETYGFGRKSAEVSTERFKKLTGIEDRCNLRRAIKRAKASGLINVVTSDNKKYPKYSIQKNYEKWSSVVTSDYVVTSDNKCSHQRLQNESPVTTVCMLKKPFKETTKENNPLSPTGGTVKILKPKKPKYTPPTGPQLKANGNPWIDAEAWDDFVKHRAEIKKPLTDQAVKKSIKFLARFRERQSEIIETSIRCGWTGLFEPKKSFQSDDVDGPRMRILEAPKDGY